MPNLAALRRIGVSEMDAMLPAIYAFQGRNIGFRLNQNSASRWSPICEQLQRSRIEASEAPEINHAAILAPAKILMCLRGHVEA
jgi:hypothetical protein